MKSTSELFPEMIWMGGPLAQCCNVFNKDVLAIITSEGTVKIGKIENDEFISENKKTVSFNSPCKKYFSLKENHFIWGYGTRDFQIIDINKNTINELIISANGNDMIYSTTPLPFNDLIICIDLVRASWNKNKSNTKTFLYSIASSAITDTLAGFNGILFILKNNKVLYEKFNHPKLNSWKIKSEIKTGEGETNKLTKYLSDTGMLVWQNSYNDKKNIMIGTAHVDDSIKFFTTKWTDDFQDISIEPLTIQVSKDTTMFDRFEFSEDGNWAKTVSRDWKKNSDSDFITFFAVNDTFPQSLSLPVYGGVSSRNGGGCFVETDDWGTVYVDITPEMPGYLVVYKMRDVMDKVIEKTRKLTQ
jgi:hypothetical protein